MYKLSTHRDRHTDRLTDRQADRQIESDVNHFPCPASGLVPLWNLWSSSKYSINHFTAPASESSGLKEPRTCLRNSIFSGPVIHLLSVLSVFFTCHCEKEDKQT